MKQGHELVHAVPARRRARPAHTEPQGRASRGTMTVHLLRYRPWRGTLRGSGVGIWPIGRVALQLMFRRKLFWATYVLGLMIFLLFFFGQYTLSWASSQAADQEVRLVGGI